MEIDKKTQKKIDFINSIRLNITTVGDINRLLNYYERKKLTREEYLGLSFLGYSSVRSISFGEGFGLNERRFTREREKNIVLTKRIEELTKRIEELEFKVSNSNKK